MLTFVANPIRYACLSHCWGSEDNMIKTPRDDSRSLLTEGIAPGVLSKIYLDAVQVRTFLSMKYFWIERLYIMQDQANDQDEQAAQMVAK